MAKHKEGKIENYLRDQVIKRKGKAYKLESSGNNGMPDRLVLLPGGLIFFIEVKAPTEKLRKLQEVQINRINSLGQKALMLDTKRKIDQFFKEIGG